MWINSETLVTYKTVDEIRAAHPGFSFPQSPTNTSFEIANVHWVSNTTPPEHNPITQNLIQETPVLIDGQWCESWSVELATPDVIQHRCEAIKANIVDLTQHRLDDFANTRGYDGILSLATYATSTNPKFQAEGQYGVEARDATWAKLYEIMAEVEAGNRPMPAGYADIEPDLPVLEWPAA